MLFKKLFIFVEGNDDERFFDKIIKKRLEKKYDSIKIIKYQQMKKTKRNKFIESIISMGADYIYVADINNEPCITAKKQKIKQKIKSIDEKKIFIVVREIESWYLAGLSREKSKELKIPIFSNTDNITKEQFNSLISKKGFSRIDFMLRILEDFSFEIAKQRNKSFRYFSDKIGL